MSELNSIEIEKLEKKATVAAKMLKSLGNRWRLLVLCELAKGERNVGEILAAVDLSQSALSQHLAVLRGAGLVKTRRESQSIFYSIKGEEATAVMSALCEIYFASKAPARKAKRVKASA